MSSGDTAAGQAAGWATREYRARPQSGWDTFGLTAEVTVWKEMSSDDCRVYGWPAGKYSVGPPFGRAPSGATA